MRLPLCKGCHLIVIVLDSMTLVVEYQFRVWKIKMILQKKCRLGELLFDNFFVKMGTIFSALHFSFQVTSHFL